MPGKPGLDVAAPDVAKVVVELAAAQKQLGKEIRIEHKAVAEYVSLAIARRALATGLPSSIANAWQGTGVAAGARLSLRRQQRAGAAAVPTYMGAKPLTRHGWNLRTYSRTTKQPVGIRTRPHKAQYRPWVGNQWIVGLPGEGPWVVRDIAPGLTPEVGRRYEAAFLRATKKVWGNT